MDVARFKDGIIGARPNDGADVARYDMTSSVARFQAKDVAGLVDKDWSRPDDGSLAGNIARFDDMVDVMAFKSDTMGNITSVSWDVARFGMGNLL